jgi:HAE1 family hydrophobic/amphiphilic exporter-1
MAMDGSFEAIRRRYLRGVTFFLRHRWISALLLVGACGLLYYFMTTTKTGLVPREDMGTINMKITTPPGTSLAQTKKVLDRIDNEILKDMEEVRAYSKLAGSGDATGPSYGSFNFRLKHWDERKGEEHSVGAIQERIKQYANKFNEGTVTTSTPAMIPGFGAAGGFTLYLQDRKGGSIEDLYQVTMDLVNGLKDRPEIGSVYTAFKPDFPQYEITVDAVKCKRAGTSPKEVLQVMSGYYGGTMSTRFNKFTKLYQVRIQAHPDYRTDRHSLNNIFVRIGEEMAPISQFVTLKRIYAPEREQRFNMFPAISVSGRAAEGRSSGEALQAVAEVAKEVLGDAYTQGDLEVALQRIVNGVNDIVQTYKRIDVLLVRKEEFPKNTSKKIKRFELPALLSDEYRAKVGE